MHLSTVILVGTAFLLHQVQVQALWPQPSTITHGEAYLRLQPTFTILPSASLQGRGPLPDDLQEAIDRALRYIDGDRLQPLRVDVQSVEEEVRWTKHTLSSLRLHLASPSISQVLGHETAFHQHLQHPLYVDSTRIRSISEEINRPVEERDESYILTVPTEHEAAELRAATSLGLLRGLQTFVQLVYTTSDGLSRYIMEAPYCIEDRAAFPVRGVGIDTSRNAYSVQDLKRTLEAASWSKINLFHWHVTDSQSWPLVLRNHPELAEKGASGWTYTPEQRKDVISFANSIGIQVMLEIDV